MRTFVIFAVFALAIAAALPSDDMTEDPTETVVDDMVPEMDLAESMKEFDAHSEAKSTLEFLQLKEGRSKDACKTLAKNTLTEVTTSITNTQKMLDRMYKGERCHLEGKAAYDASIRRYNTAKRNLDTANRRLRTALNYQVDFGRYTFGGLREGSCDVFFRDGAYIRAKAIYKQRKVEQERATGALRTAKKARDEARKLHLDLVLRCRCRVKKEHSKAWSSANKNNGSNAKAWKKAKHMLCVLADTPEARCNTSGLRKLSKPRLPSAVTNARPCNGSYKSTFKCQIKSKSTTNAGVVRTGRVNGMTLTGGGMHQRLGAWNARAAVEQFYPNGGHGFNCDTGFGPGSVNCYGVYCSKNNRALQCTTRSARKRGSGTQRVNLPGGYVMTGGGVYNHYRHWNKKAQFEQSVPSGNSWVVDMGTGSGDFTAYVTGCKGISCKTVNAGKADYSVATCPKGYLVTGCGVNNVYRRWDRRSAFEYIRPESNRCVCNMGFGAGQQYCYARCCK